MDFIKSWFSGSGSSPNSKTPAQKQKPIPKLRTTGPFTHPSNKDTLYALTLESVATKSNGPLDGQKLWFFIWKPSFYAKWTSDISKGNDDKTKLSEKYRVLASSHWELSDSLQLTYNLSTNSNEKSQTIQLEVDSNPKSNEWFPDIIQCYFDKINKYIVETEKKIRQAPQYSEPLHKLLYAILCEVGNLEEVLIHFTAIGSPNPSSSSSTDTSNTQQTQSDTMKFKQLNELITRAVLAMDNVEVDENIPVLDSNQRLRRKSLVNFALQIGNELGSLIKGCSWAESRNQEEYSRLHKLASPAASHVNILKKDNAE